jgi:Calcineurin-like phosphoesterase
MSERSPSSIDPLIGPVLQQASSTAISLLWVRHDQAPCQFQCQAGSVAAIEQTVCPAYNIDESSDAVYLLHLDALEPDTEYSYVLTLPGGKCESSFRTFPADNRPVSFIYYGDNKNAEKIHSQVVGHFSKYDPLFIMHSGDMTEHGHYNEYAPLLFEPLRQATIKWPLFPARGNHEGNGNAYRQVFDLPNNDTWYSFDCGPVHVIVLDTTGWRHEWEADDVPRMQKWLEDDLAAAQDAPWRIAMYHEPSYDLGWRKDDWGHKGFLAAMRKGNVDLTLSGHAHGYQRLHAMKTPGENDLNPITHVISAGAGANLGKKLLDPSPFLAADARRFNFIVFDISQETLRARVFCENGKPLDTFELTKKDNKYAPDFISAAFCSHDYPG